MPAGDALRREDRPVNSVVEALVSSRGSRRGRGALTFDVSVASHVVSTATGQCQPSVAVALVTVASSTDRASRLLSSDFPDENAFTAGCSFALRSPWCSEGAAPEAAPFLLKGIPVTCKSSLSLVAMQNGAKALYADKRGAVFVEYAVVIGAIAFAGSVGLIGVGIALVHSFDFVRGLLLCPIP